MSSSNKIQQLIASVAKHIEDNEKLLIPILSSKLNKYAEAYPYDQTIGNMRRIIEKMDDNKTFSIRKADFKNLYHKLYSRNSKFAELFADELKLPETQSNITTYQRDDSKNEVSYQGDQVLANVLESVFDKTIPLKQYSKKIANQAIKTVIAALDAWNIKPSNVNVAEGNEKFIVVQADYETPKGITSFYVPVEVVKDSIVNPEVFIGNTGVGEINYKTVRAYLTQNAGNKIKIGSSNLLTALNNSISNQQISDTELAIARLHSSRKGNTEFANNSIVGLKVEAKAKKDVELPKSDEFMSFEKQFSTPQGLANWKFGDHTVKIGSNHISRQLNSYGYNNHQITVLNNNEDTIFYGVALGTKTAFTVPVKVANKQISKPNLMICNGSLSEFNKDNINQLISENRLDVKVAAVASNMSSLKPSEIVNNLRQAMLDENYDKAEDALNVLANSGDEKAYLTAFQMYMNGLSTEKQAETKCSKMIKNANSEYPICSHTGLPINKVYQDKNGYCLPLYRRGMDETYEGASFMNAKVFG